MKLIEIMMKEFSSCGWNDEHFRGCLKSLEKMHQFYPDEMNNLRNKTVTFCSQFTGVSLDGDVVIRIN